MYDYIKGLVTELTPSYVVIELNGIGYFINISLYTYEKIKDFKEVQVFVEQIIREDAFLLFGFADKLEREVFRYLISVSGIGANTARLMLSSLNPQKIIEAIENEDVRLLKNIKGIGLKTAQRVIVELKDKITTSKLTEAVPQSKLSSQKVLEALDALIVLGFNKKISEETLNVIISQTPEISLEHLIKAAIQKMSK